MAKNVPTTKKDSPSVKISRNKTDGPAAEYAPPHTMTGKKFGADAIEKNPEHPMIGMAVEMPTRKNWTPLNGGVSIGHDDKIETEGIKIRGTGAAERGVMSRGPMA